MKPPLEVVSLLLLTLLSLPLSMEARKSVSQQGEKSVLENIIETGDEAFGVPASDEADSSLAELVEMVENADSITRYTELTDADFLLVAKELGVELAAIKAVALIEAGSSMKGFYAPGVPVVNFQQSMFNRFKSKGGSPGPKDEKVPAGLSGYALKEWTQLVKARKQNLRAANMGTFWGMFQIGGFNYSKCGCSSIDEFVRLMGVSELEQLELFAAFIMNCGMLDDLRKKNWAAFARKYNGAGYAKRGYHTRMANAYKKFAAEEKKKK